MYYLQIYVFFYVLFLKCVVFRREASVLHSLSLVYFLQITSVNPLTKSQSKQYN